MTTTHAITFTGELLDGFERAEVMARFAARFGLKGAQVDKVFCGQPVTLKKGLDEAKARAYVKTLNELGMRTVSSSPFDVTESPKAPGYSILFDGSVVAGHDREAVKRTAAQRLKFSDAQRDRLFSGDEVTMKRGLDEEKARHYVKTLRLMGMNARVEPPLPEPATTAAPAPAPAATSAPEAARTPESTPTPEPTPTPKPVVNAASTASGDTPARASDNAEGAAPTPHIAPKKAARDDTELSEAEASLMVTQFSPVPAYDMENTFHSSSTLDAAATGGAGNDGDAALHEALRDSPLAKPAPPAAEAAPASAAKTADTGKKDNMMATVVNADALKDYEDALADDPSIDALRAEHDPVPKKTTPEAAADAIKSAAADAGAAAATTGVDLASTGAKSGDTSTAEKESNAKATTNVDKRDAASPVHEQDTVLAELDTGRDAKPAAATSPPPAAEPEAKKSSHTLLVVLIVIAAAAAAWLLLST